MSGDKRSNANAESVTVLNGDCREMLRTLPDASVHCVVTSPPYFGLRDYGTATWEGGDPSCAHVKPFVPISARTAGEANISKGGAYNDQQDIGRSAYRDQCGDCGATRVDSQIGLEQTPDAYVAEMVAVFREIRRVLHPSGTAWLNLGDSYAGSWGNQGRKETRGTQRPINGPMLQNLEPYPMKASNTGAIPAGSGLKPKDLIGIPWRVALALQADGWWLRQDIVWAKKAPMPESVTDRFTRSHEFVFLLTKSERYYFDQDAVAETAMETRGVLRFSNQTAKAPSLGSLGSGNEAKLVSEQDERPTTRNKRDVWLLGPEPTPFAHFATFPQALVEPCILAGSSEKGCCPECLAPWRRVVERTPMLIDRSDRREQMGEFGRTQSSGTMVQAPSSRTVGWEPTCAHGHDPIPCVVLDPFAGSGTTLRVAVKHRRRAMGIELNPEYCRLIEQRIVTPVMLPLDTEAAS